MKKIIVLSALVTVFYSCQPPAGSSNDTEIKELKALKKETDYKINDKSLTIWVKVKGTDKPQKVENRRYPKEIETTYNVLRDAKGRLRYVAEIPFSPENDWFISYKSYFDSTGNLYAFQRLNNFMNSGCVKGALMENSLKFYNREHKMVDSIYSLSDTYKKAVQTDGCKFPYNFPYARIFSADEYQRAKKLEM